MREPLQISLFRNGLGVKTMKVKGFTEQEVVAFSLLPMEERIDAVLKQLDERNGNTGTCWHNGNGVYSVYVLHSYPTSVLVEIGSGCD